MDKFYILSFCYFIFLRLKNKTSLIFSFSQITSSESIPTSVHNVSKNFVDIISNFSHFFYDSLFYLMNSTLLIVATSMDTVGIILSIL